MLEVRNLSKKYDGNYVLKNINFKIEAGKIYGIIGANGSGKSTFMNILNGNEVIAKTGGYEGSILIDGTEVVIKNHQQSLKAGIAMVHQELALFSGMKVFENIKINREEVKGKGFLISEFDYIDRQKNEEDSRRTLRRIGSDVEPERVIDELSLNQKQFVEIARELDNEKIRLLILDEPTSSLNILETKHLLKCIREIAESGLAVIFISHRMEEVMEICDKAAVLRDGELISVYEKSEFQIEKFADDMVGQSITKARRTTKRKGNAPLLSYKNIQNRGEELSILEGEIIGITGLAGQGQELLTDGLAGLKRAEYDVVYKGKQLEKGDNESLIKNGIYYLSEDRASTSLFLESPVWKNVIFGTEEKHPEFLAWQKCPALSFYNKKEIYAHVQNMIDQLHIVCSGPKQKVRALSGGNQQKVCVSRALTFMPELLIIGEPTRGIDIYSKELILNWLVKMNQELHTTILIASGELEELTRICDRIVVMYQGRVFKIFDGGSSLEELTLAMYGREGCEN